MNRQLTRGLAVVLVISLWQASIAWAQTQTQPQTGRKNRGNNNTDAKKAPAVKLPDDPRLLSLHKQLVRDAEKIAVEYQRDKQLDKARVVYEEILRVTPSYNSAANALQKIRGTEATTNREVFEVSANKGWQDTGLDVVEGRPVVFRVFEGKWHLLMDYRVGPDGIEIPKELRQFNLGSLIGIIMPPGEKPGEHHTPPPSADSTKAEVPAENAPAASNQATADSTTNSTDSSDPNAVTKEEAPKGPQTFLVGSKLDLMAPNSGRLFLRMYDAQPDDNTGKIKVTITSTFGHPPTYAGSKKSSTLTE